MTTSSYVADRESTIESLFHARQQCVRGATIAFQNIGKRIERLPHDLEDARLLLFHFNPRNKRMQYFTQPIDR